MRLSLGVRAIDLKLLIMPKEIQTTDPMVAKALQIIWDHSHREISVQEIVSQLPVTRRTLERKFNLELGHCIGKEIIMCRLTRAKHMLVNTSLPVEHIALATGFSGSERLAKVFKQYENITPGKFRKRSEGESSFEFLVLSLEAIITEKFSGKMEFFSKKDKNNFRYIAVNRGFYWTYKRPNKKNGANTQHPAKA